MIVTAHPDLAVEVLHDRGDRFGLPRIPTGLEQRIGGVSFPALGGDRYVERRSSFQQRRTGREETLANCAVTFRAVPDLVIYPQDDSNRSLPYIDCFDGELRIAMPWRGIGRFTGTLEVPGIGVIEPTGRCANFIGIDRYTLTSDFKIIHIDTDWDLAYAAIQMSPVGFPSMGPRALRAIAMLERIVVPPVRFLGRDKSPNEHRRLTVGTNAGNGAASAGLDCPTRSPNRTTVGVRH